MPFWMLVGIAKYVYVCLYIDTNMYAYIGIFDPNIPFNCTLSNFLTLMTSLIVWTNHSDYRAAPFSLQSPAVQCWQKPVFYVLGRNCPWDESLRLPRRCVVDTYSFSWWSRLVGAGVTRPKDKVGPGHRTRVFVNIEQLETAKKMEPRGKRCDSSLRLMTSLMWESCLVCN